MARPRFRGGSAPARVLQRSCFRSRRSSNPRRRRPAYLVRNPAPRATVRSLPLPRTSSTIATAFASLRRCRFRTRQPTSAAPMHPRRQSRSSGTAAGAADRRDRRVAIGLVRSGADRTTEAIVRTGQAARFRLGESRVRRLCEFGNGTNPGAPERRRPSPGTHPDFVPERHCRKPRSDRRRLLRLARRGSAGRVISASLLSRLSTVDLSLQVLEGVLCLADG